MGATQPIDLITGSAGIVGTHLAEALAGKSRRVRALDLKRWPSYPPGTETILGDVRDTKLLQKSLQGVEHVYHLSTLINHDRVSPKVFHSVMVKGGSMVARLAHQAGVKRIIALTTTEVYGHLGPEPRTEDGPRRPLDTYGQAKVALEDALFAMAQEGAPVTVLRPPVIIGPRFQFSPVPRVFQLFRKNLPVPIPGDGSFRVQSVHVRDVVSLAMVAATHNRAIGEAFNVASSEVPTYRGVMEALRDYIGSHSPLVSIPLRPTLFFMRLANRFTSPFFLEPGQFEITGEDYLLSLEKAHRLLNWKPQHTNLEAFFDAYDWHLCTSPYPKPPRLRPTFFEQTPRRN